uniref:Uncharacterized protein n=1 Tax=Strix occidentalis caurina TaxID=311401 RepID=A0A8D0KU32_STROC
MVKIQPVPRLFQLPGYDANGSCLRFSFCLIKAEQEFHIEQSSDFIKSLSTILILWYVRISRSSVSTSFFASSLSARIKLKAMTSPRCCTSMLSCKQSLCRISSHWVVFKGERDH